MYLHAPTRNNLDKTQLLGGSQGSLGRREHSVDRERLGIKEMMSGPSGSKLLKN